MKAKDFLDHKADIIFFFNSNTLKAVLMNNFALRWFDSPCMMLHHHPHTISVVHRMWNEEAEK